jgi:hypothetical protein
MEWQSTLLPRYAAGCARSTPRKIYLGGANLTNLLGAQAALAGGPLSKNTTSRIVPGASEPGRGNVADPSPQRLGSRVPLPRRLPPEGADRGKVSPVPMLAAFGIQRTGQKVLLHPSLGGSERTNAWAAVCEDLRERGARCPASVHRRRQQGVWAAVQQT